MAMPTSGIGFFGFLAVSVSASFERAYRRHSNHKSLTSPNSHFEYVREPCEIIMIEIKQLY